MKSKILHRLSAAFKFYLEATTLYQVHSPIMYSYARAVFHDKDPLDAFDRIEQKRAWLLRNHRQISGMEEGAGSTIPHSRRTVAQFAASAVSPARKGRQLYRIAALRTNPTILELGTGTGISTMYLSLAALSGQVYTMEANECLMAIARENFEALGSTNIHSQCGTFERVLPALLSGIDTIDVAFIDGYHAEEPTVRYTEMIRSKLSPKGIIIIDDIHWSEGMTNAWDLLKKQATVSIDFYRFGLLAYHPYTTYPQHLSLISSWYKPWKAIAIY